MESAAQEPGTAGEADRSSVTRTQTPETARSSQQYDEVTPQAGAVVASAASPDTTARAEEASSAASVSRETDADAKVAGTGDSPDDVSRETAAPEQLADAAQVPASLSVAADGSVMARGEAVGGSVAEPPSATAPEVAEEAVSPGGGAAVPANGAPGGARGSMPRPDRTRVMVVANQKGGVGKTTTTVNLAVAMAQHGLRVLVIDLDPQGNASTALSIEHHRGVASTYDALVDGVPLAEIAQESPEVPGLMVVPATIDLAGAEIELVSVVARENRLRKAILGDPRVFAEGEERFDYVLIDCPPSLGLLTLNALVAAEEMLVPIQSEYYALEGVGQLLETVELVRSNLNPVLTISTVLLTMYDARTRLSAGVADEVRTHFGDRVLRTAIPRSVRVSEAPSYGQSVMTYDPASPGALSYLEAARELAIKGASR